MQCKSHYSTTKETFEYLVKTTNFQRLIDCVFDLVFRLCRSLMIWWIQYIKIFKEFFFCHLHNVQSSQLLHFESVVTPSALVLF